MITSKEIHITKNGLFEVGYLGGSQYDYSFSTINSGTAQVVGNNSASQPKTLIDDDCEVTTSSTAGGLKGNLNYEGHVSIRVTGATDPDFYFSINKH